MEEGCLYFNTERKRSVSNCVDGCCISHCHCWPQWTTHSVWTSILCIWKCGGGCVCIRCILKFFAFQSHTHINRNRKCGWGSGGIKTFLYCWHDCKLVQFGEKVAVWIKLKMYITCYPVISLWGIFLQKTFIHVHRETKTKILTAQYL